MQAAGLELTLEDIIACRIHHVRPEKIQELRDVLADTLSLEDILTATIHKMPAGYLKSFRAAGFADWRPDDLVAFYHHRIPADYVRGLFDLGVTEPEEVIQAFIEGVSIEDLKTVLRNGSEDQGQEPG